MTRQELETLIAQIIEQKGGEASDKIVASVMEKLTPFMDAAKKNFIDPALALAEEQKKTMFKSFGDQLLAVRKAATGMGVDARLKAASGLNESTPSDGGFLVQQDFAEGLIKKVHDTGLLARKCKRIPISAKANGIILNAVDEVSRENGSRWGGVQVYWANEADTVAASKPKFRQMDLKLEKLIGIYYATEEILADTVALEAVVNEAFAEEFGYKVDDVILFGTGVGQPLGILNSPALITVPKEGAQLADTIVEENIQKMWNRMPARNRMKADWYINQDNELALNLLNRVIGTGGVPLYLPPGGLSQSPYSVLMSRPVIPIEQASAMGDAGDFMLLDFSEYLLVDKAGIAAAESIHVRFLQGEDTFRFTYRLDGEPLWNSPLKAAKGGTTRSPYIVLGDR
jgi:HK97 family phage major capsid protein